MYLVKESNLIESKILSSNALLLFKLLNNLIIKNKSEDFTISLSIDDMSKMLSVSRDVVIKVKNELVAKEFISQNKSYASPTVYKLEAISYEILVSSIMEILSNSDNIWQSNNSTIKYIYNILNIFKDIKEIYYIYSLVEKFDCQSFTVNNQKNNILLIQEDTLETSCVNVNAEISIMSSINGKEGVGVLTETISCSANNSELPKPININNISVMSNIEVETDSKPRVGKLKSFEEVIKPLEKWNVNDFIDYFKNKYCILYHNKPGLLSSTRQQMSNLRKKLGNVELKKQIDCFFNLIKLGKINKAPTWNSFFGTDTQQKLDHYRVTGYIVGYDGTIEEKSIRQLRLEKEAFEKTPEGKRLKEEEEAEKEVIYKISDLTCVIDGEMPEKTEEELKEYEQLILTKGINACMKYDVSLVIPLLFLYYRGYDIKSIVKQYKIDYSFLDDSFVTGRKLSEVLDE